MSQPRDYSSRVSGRAVAAAAGAPQKGRDPTESLAPPGDDEAAAEEWSDGDPEDEDVPPLSVSQAPMGTRQPRNAPTRIESPAARNRTGDRPGPPTPETPPRRARPSKPPPRGEKPEERIGQVLGSYRLVELLGRGGMGFVYRAEHVKLGRPVALKLLRADYAKRRDSVARFFQEARTVNRVRHRNIVDVTDFVELDDGTTFIIMELLEGKSLGRWAKETVSVPRALALLVQICDGLAAAHAVGVIHRDLKPDNIFVIPTGDGAEIVKLLDFGVAKLLHRDDDDHDLGLQTQAGSVIGTPAYMSPEQAGGMPVDGRADIYSLGAIMYELFCGQPMFKGKSFGEYVRKHLAETPVAPRATPGGAGMDERLEAVIMRCLEKEPDHRYQALPELRDELLHLLGAIETHVGLVRDLAESLSSADLVPSSSAGSRPGSVRQGRSSRRAVLVADVAPEPEPVAAPARRAPWPWVITAVAAVAAVGVVVAVVGRGGGGDDAPGAPEAPAARPTTPRPSVSPMQPPGGAPDNARAEPRRVAVRFESTPAGAVYAVGSAQPKCSTPCAVEIDLADGGSTTHRDFIVRADGHEDAAVTVDLGEDAPVVSVELTRRGGARRGPADGTTTDDGTPGGAAPAAGTGEPAAAAPGTSPATDAPADGDPPSESGGGGDGPSTTAATDRKPPRPPRDDKPDKPGPTVTEPTPDPAPGDDKAGNGDKSGKKSGKIDPTDTIDPFR